MQSKMKHICYKYDYFFSYILLKFLAYVVKFVIQVSYITWNIKMNARYQMAYIDE